ncbi:MAG: hypothetical protein A2992_08405 [Elusimicrobia bacterium RIFCSPLOWO2_01_FULL_59_12]|nr:MAG: hypothetical protein A2992_08405 [Elusimicrobia bacterium RIFCSPLOWO2_01_FULL_59_12]
MKKIQGIHNDRGYTELRIWLGPKRNPDGSVNRPYRRIFGAYTLPNILRAKEHMDQVRRDFKAGKMPKPEPKPILFTQAADIFYHRHFELRQRSHKSKRNARSLLNNLKTYWPTRCLDSFKPIDIEQYREAMTKDRTGSNGRTKKGLGLGTINHHQSILSSLFERMDEYVKREEIDPVRLPEFNPCLYVAQPSTEHLKRERVASREELKNVHRWASLHDPEMLEAVKRAILSGLRKEDMRRMQGETRIRTLTGKTKRLVALPLDWSKAVNLSNWQKRWEALRENCDMQDFHWHDWRHTGATMLKELGVAEEIIQEILAHSNIQQTRAYINRKEERLRPAIEALKRELDVIMPSVTAA